MSKQYSNPNDEALEIALGNGCFDELGKLIWPFIALIGALGLAAVLISGFLEKSGQAAADKAWARAAQLDAQANLQGARTANLEALLSGMLPYVVIVAIIAVLAFAVMAFLRAPAQVGQQQYLPPRPTIIVIGDTGSKRQFYQLMDEAVNNQNVVDVKQTVDRSRA